MPYLWPDACCRGDVTGRTLRATMNAVTTADGIFSRATAVTARCFTTRLTYSQKLNFCSFLKNLTLITFWVSTFDPIFQVTNHVLSFVFHTASISLLLKSVGLFEVFLLEIFLMTLESSSIDAPFKCCIPIQPS